MCLGRSSAHIAGRSAAVLCLFSPGWHAAALHVLPPLMCCAVSIYRPAACRRRTAVRLRYAPHRKLVEEEHPRLKPLGASSFVWNFLFLTTSFLRSMRSVEGGLSDSTWQAYLDAAPPLCSAAAGRAVTLHG